jgi:hypothetical protein
MLVKIGCCNPGLQVPILSVYTQWSFCSLGDFAETMWILR